MLNKVILIGRLGANPELRSTQSGLPVSTLRVATDESFVDRNGDRQQRTEWHRVVTFQRTAENCSQYLHTGSLVYVEGKLTTRKWTDQTGQERYTTEIRADRVIFLERKNANNEYSEDPTYSSNRQSQTHRDDFSQDQQYTQSRPATRGSIPQRQQVPPMSDDYDSEQGPVFPSEINKMQSMDNSSSIDDIPF